MNVTRSGILLTDTTGDTGNLVVANGDLLNTADRLGLTVDDSVSSVDGGTLNLQVISHQTLLSSLNGGAGVYPGSFIISSTEVDPDSGQPRAGAVKLNEPGAEFTTVGEVIDAINALGIGLSARINDSGDGILLADTAGGAGTLSVREVGNGTTAKDLNILGTAQEIDVGGSLTQAIDGSTAVTVEIDADDTLEDLITTINDLDARSDGQFAL